MKIFKFSLGQLQTNCYFLIKGEECLIIDPADEASFILEELQRRRLKLTAMLATHGHFDHLMAAGEIQASLDGLFYINNKDKFLLNRIEKTAEYFLGFKQSVLPIKKIKYLTNEKKLKISNFEFQILASPGHTPGSVCYYFKKEKIIFTGDILFKKTIGRYDFSYSDKKNLKESLLILKKLPEEIIVYPGHGEKTTIEKEQNNLLHYINIL